MRISSKPNLYLVEHSAGVRYPRHGLSFHTSVLFHHLRRRRVPAHCRRPAPVDPVYRTPTMRVKRESTRKIQSRRENLCHASSSCRHNPTRRPATLPKAPQPTANVIRRRGTHTAPPPLAPSLPRPYLALRTHFPFSGPSVHQPTQSAAKAAPARPDSFARDNARARRSRPLGRPRSMPRGAERPSRHAAASTCGARSCAGARTAALASTGSCEGVVDWQERRVRFGKREWQGA